MTTWRDLGDERFVSLTTFRRSGEPVATPVWVALDGDTLVVTTPAESGKVKRLRRDARVELRPCTRFGAVVRDAPCLGGTADILEDQVTGRRLTGLIRGKYGFEFVAVMTLERLGRGGRKPRVVLRLTPG